MNMSGVSSSSGMSGMSGCSGSQHSQMAAGRSSAAVAKKGSDAAKTPQPINLEGNLGSKVDIAV